MAVPEIKFEKFPAAPFPAAALPAAAIGRGLHPHRLAVAATAVEGECGQSDEKDSRKIFMSGGPV